MQDKRELRYVITAAHWLPHLPEGFAIGHVHERTCFDLLGPLGGERTIPAECVFVDPIADIAVLGSPDSNAMSEEADAYEALTKDHLPPVAVAVTADADDDWEEQFRRRGSPKKQKAWLISLDGSPQQCTLTHMPNGPWWIEGAAGIVGGMSGSPILAEDGETAIGFVCNSSGIGSGTPDDPVSTGGGPNPRLAMNLPVWLLRELTAG